MTHYQGEDIEFGLSLTHLDVSDMTNWNQASRVVVYFYTHTNHIAKYSSQTQTGYTRMNLSSSTLYTGVIPSADTKVMEGELLCDIYIKLASGGNEKIRRVSTGINILSTPIKIETT